MESNLMFLIFITILAFVRGQNEYCYSTDENPYLGFATKSPYDGNSTKDIAVPSDCKVVYVYALIRHGTRYPKASDKLTPDELNQMRFNIVENNKKNTSNLCAQDVETLKKWTYSWDEKTYGKLATRGLLDMENLADRIKSSLTNFFKNCTKDKLLLRTSSKSRCQESALAFSNRLMTTTYTNLDGNGIAVNDGLLRFSHDPANELGDERLESENHKFKKSDAIRNVISQVSKRCGYQSDLSFDQIMKMYTQCTFEKSINLRNKSAFCVVFTPDHLKTLEYLDDLDTYYKLGYGSFTYSDRSCPLIRDLHERLREIENNTNAGPSKIATFNFGHTSSICPFVTILGLRKDEEALKSDNFEKYKDYRKWRASNMSPFAGNLFVIVYKCTGEVKVAFYNNEKYIRLDDADSADVVPYKMVIEKLEAVGKVCGGGGGVSGAARFSLVLKQHLLLVLILLLQPHNNYNSLYFLLSDT